MKKLLLLFLLPVSVWATSRTISINAPSSVITRQAATVLVSVSTDATDSEQIGFFHAEFSTDSGVTWSALCYDVNVGKSATRTAYITAGGTGSTIVVRVRVAFRGGAAGDVAADGSAIDWSGTWNAWSTPVPTRYASINVEASPNGEPSARDLNEGLRVTLDPSTGAFHLSWWGRHNRLYLLEGSADLLVWTPLPSVEVGLEAPLAYGLSTNASRYFLRLRHSDDSDFDRDGLSNLEELSSGTNPASADSDGDGMTDGWERAHGLDASNPGDASSFPPGGNQTYLTLYLAEKGLLERCAAATLPAGMQLVLRTTANGFRGVKPTGEIASVATP